MGSDFADIAIVICLVLGIIVCVALGVLAFFTYGFSLAAGILVLVVSIFGMFGTILLIEELT